ncbi:amidase domain-containing protein [Ruminiclostridium josui]|uniref:amidase domain-containing protein n=1 Tax=Ruminiclostridium josui TaxID=1499 RepID=UPI000557D00A|nr:amidase domain-containing protein [Ruminiclostridium josui]
MFNFIKKVITLFLSCLIILCPVSLQAKPINYNLAVQVTTEFLCAKIKSVVSHNVDEIDIYFSNKTEATQRNLLFIKKQLLEDYIIAYASNDYIIEKVNPKVKIDKTLFVDNCACIKATLTADIYWNAANPSGKPIKGLKSEVHLITLSFDNGVWKITQDKFQTKKGNSDKLTRDNLSDLYNQILTLKSEAEKALKKAYNSKSSRLVPYNTQWKTSYMCTSSVNNDEYNRDKVYNWAYNHWNNYSKEYINFGDEKWKGGDCTNFVSQCLRAGGAVNDKTGAFQWYYSKKGALATPNDDYSWTWSTARGLNSTLLGNFKNNEFGPKATQKVIVGDNQYTASIGKYIVPGDIIQYHWKNKSFISHAAIIVGMVYNSGKERYEPVIAEHTEDSWFTPWTNNAYKTYFVHITGIN